MFVCIFNQRAEEVATKSRITNGILEKSESFFPKRVFFFLLLSVLFCVSSRNIMLNFCNLFLQSWKQMFLLDSKTLSLELFSFLEHF